MNQPQTIIDKLWAAHEILRREDGDVAALGRPALRPRGLVPRLRQARRARRQGRRAGADLRRRRPLRADPRLADRYRQSRARAHGAPGRGEHRKARRQAVRPRRSAAGHRPRGRAGAGPDPARPADRLRRQPHLDPRRARRLCVRHRRVRSGPCADDADDLAEEAEADARHGRRPGRAGHLRQGHRAGHHRARSAPTARPAARWSSPAPRSARCRSKAG